MTTHWRITHDPLGLCSTEAASDSQDAEAREHGEDILQLEVCRANGSLRIVDLGWYCDRYVVLEVEKQAWDAPSFRSEFPNLAEAMTQVRRLLQ